MIPTAGVKSRPVGQSDERLIGQAPRKQIAVVGSRRWVSQSGESALGASRWEETGGFRLSGSAEGTHAGKARLVRVRARVNAPEPFWQAGSSCVSPLSTPHISSANRPAHRLLASLLRRKTSAPDRKMRPVITSGD